MKRFSIIVLLCILIIPLQAQKKKKTRINLQLPDVEVYGSVRNDFYFDSRDNEAGIDGLFHFYPKPPVLKDGADINAHPEASMLAIATRFGFDIHGRNIGKAQSFAKIEADFAGFGSADYVLRLRHAYMQLKWNKSKLLVGQTWHPLWGLVVPTTFSQNAGMPFQPFNRSPQIMFQQNMSDAWSAKLAALYQMQYTSTGPEGFTSKYMRRAIAPEAFIGIEYNTERWKHGVGGDFKMIKPDPSNYLHSFAATIYSGFSDEIVSIKAKATAGQNMSDQLLPNGYGQTYNAHTGKIGYSNLNVATGWLNLVMGNKWQVSLLGGYLHNLGSFEKLHRDNTNYDRISLYSRGFYFDSQEFIDRMYRASAGFSYNLSNLSVGIEYDYTAAEYGELKVDGRTKNNYWIDNHRIVAAMVYSF